MRFAPTSALPAVTAGIVPAQASRGSVILTENWTGTVTITGNC